MAGAVFLLAFAILQCYNALMIRKIFKTGHSAAITLSAGLLKSLGLKLGDAVKIDFEESKNRLVITPGHKASQLAMDLRIRPKLGLKK